MGFKNQKLKKKIKKNQQKAGKLRPINVMSKNPLTKRLSCHLKIIILPVTKNIQYIVQISRYTKHKLKMWSTNYLLCCKDIQIKIKFLKIK